MPNLGMGELLVVLVIVLLVFGANRLPQIGEGVGKAIRNLKRGLAAEDDIDVTDVTPEKKQVTAKTAKTATEEVVEAEVVD